MKFCRMNGPSESEVESLLMSPCWGQTQTGSSQDQYLLDGHKLLLEHDLDSLPSDSEQKSTLDVLDNLLMNSTTLNGLSDLKPLPPFTGYTGHLSINGISGHHYHAIAQRLPDESNNNYVQSAYHTITTGSTTTHQHNHHNHHHHHHHHQQQQQQQQQHQQQHHSPSSGGGTPSSLSSSSNGGGGSGGSGGGGAGAVSSANGGGNNSHSNGSGGSGSTSSTDHNIVSSSTCLPESVLSGSDSVGGPADACLSDVKLFADSQIDNKLYSVADSCVMATTTTTHNNNNNNNNSVTDQGPDSVHSGVRIYSDTKDLAEYVDMNSIDDIAAIIGSAIADTTVPNQLDNDDGTDTRDSWMDIDAWIDGNCIQQDGKLIVSQQDSLSDFILPNSPGVHNGSSTLHSLLTHGYMPLLQNRLQNGPPSSSIKSEAPSSTSYCNELSSSTSASSPPGSVVSTTDNILINTRFLVGGAAAAAAAAASAGGGVANSANSVSTQYQVTMSAIKSDGICSPEILANYPHTTTVTPTTTTTTPKAKRSRTQKKSIINNNVQQQQQQQQPQSQHPTHQQQQQHHQSSSSSSSQSQMNALSPSSVNFNSNDLSGLLGKEKPVHRCSICNRGFLNKSNIKVHLRTHTGEKPFRCDVCAKAFRQKAHLLKHQQIHKRIGRD